MENAQNVHTRKGFRKLDRRNQASLVLHLSSSEVVSLKEESSTVQSLKEEFTQRIADTERKAQVACKERDIAKKVPRSSPAAGRRSACRAGGRGYVG